MYCSKSTLSLLREPVALRGCLDVHVSRSGRRGMSSEVKSMEKQVWGPLGRGKASLPRKRDEKKYSTFGYCTFIVKITIHFAVGKLWMKMCALQFWLPFPLCSPLSKIIIFYKCQWNVVRVKLHFWRTRCQLCQISMNRYIYIHFFKERKATHHPACKTVKDLGKNYGRLSSRGKGNLVLKIFGALQWIRDINRVPPPASLVKNWSA